MQITLYIRYFVLSILLWGCASRNSVPGNAAPDATTGGNIPLLLFLLIPVLLFVMAALYFCWVVLMKHRKSLVAAQVNLHQQEMKAASLVFQLREATGKYRELQEKLNLLQMQEHKDESRPGNNVGDNTENY